MSPGSELYKASCIPQFARCCARLVSRLGHFQQKIDTEAATERGIRDRRAQDAHLVVNCACRFFSPVSNMQAASSSLTDSRSVVAGTSEANISLKVIVSEVWSVCEGQRGEHITRRFHALRSINNSYEDDSSTTFYSANSDISSREGRRTDWNRHGGLNSLLPVLERSSVDGDGEREIPLSNVFNLREGDVFAQRYRIQRRVPNRPLEFCAVHVETYVPVALKFYPYPYCGLSNSIAKHERADQNELVCRVVEYVKADTRFPPCLICEGGESSLESMLGQTDLPLVFRLTLVFKALRKLHEQSIVHGSLRPNNLVWCFPDFTCKIADFDNARFAGEDVTPEICLNAMAPETVFQYAAPEVVQSMNEKEPLRYHASCDIWSAGVMAYALLSGKQLYGSSPSAEEILDVACSRKPIPAVDGVDGQARAFLQTVLCRDPLKRPTAAVALQHDVFRSLDKPPNHIEIREVYERLTSLEGAVHAQLTRAIAADANTSVTLEWFNNASTSDDAFYERPAAEALCGDDDDLRGEKFHLMKIGESCRLRIVIKHDPNSRVRVQEMTSIRLAAPDTEAVELEKEMITNDTTACEVVALVDPARIQSERLRAVCPVFGCFDKRYVRLDLRLEFVVDGEANQALEVHRVLYCKTVHPQSRLLFHRFRAQCQRQWKALPGWARKMTQGLICCAKAGVLVV